MESTGVSTSTLVKMPSTIFSQCIILVSIVPTVHLHNVNDLFDKLFFPLFQVMFAIGREPCTKGIGLEDVGVKLHPKYVCF